MQGLVSCAKCGYGLYRTSTRSSARTIYYYRCLGSDGWRRLGGPVCDCRPVRQDLLDEVVWKEIARLLEEPSLIQEELDRRLEAARKADPTQRREEALRRDLARCRKSIERLLTAYQESLLSLEELRNRMPDLRGREQACLAELQAIEDQSKEREICLRLAESVTDFLGRLRSSAQTLDVGERQRVLRLLVSIGVQFCTPNNTCEEGVTQAPAPARLIEGGLPTEAPSRMCSFPNTPINLPLYRQAQIYARQGISLDRSTLANWVGRAAWHLRPLHERLLEHIRASTKIFADETTAPVLDAGRGRTKTGQLWAYARDDRPFGGADPPIAVYVYAQNSKAEQLLAHLAGFTGVVQVDGYAGYRALARRNSVQLAFCWSHVRRRFYELAAAGPAPIASETLERIGALYAVEKDVRGRNPDQRRAARQENSRTIVDALEPWLREKLALISQKTKLAEAIRYALSRWDGLTRFIDDGRIGIDSNVVERAIRPIALNRKNALFAGSDGGAENWAIVASLVETCKLNGVDPQAYMADVLTKIVNGHLASKLDELMPWAYATPIVLRDVA